MHPLAKQSGIVNSHYNLLHARTIIMRPKLQAHIYMLLMSD